VRVDAEIGRQLADLGCVEVVRRRECQGNDPFVAQAVGTPCQEVAQRGGFGVFLRTLVELREKDPARLVDGRLDLRVVERRKEAGGKVAVGEAADVRRVHLPGRVRPVQLQDDILQRRRADQRHGIACGTLAHCARIREDDDLLVHGRRRRQPIRELLLTRVDQRQAGAGDRPGDAAALADLRGHGRPIAHHVGANPAAAVRAQLQGHDAEHRRVDSGRERAIAAVLVLEEQHRLLDRLHLVRPTVGQCKTAEVEQIVAGQEGILRHAAVRELDQGGAVIPSQRGNPQGVADQHAAGRAPRGKLRQLHQVLKLRSQADGRRGLADVALKAPIADVRRHEGRGDAGDGEVAIAGDRGKRRDLDLAQLLDRFLNGRHLIFGAPIRAALPREVFACRDHDPAAADLDAPDECLPDLADPEGIAAEGARVQVALAARPRGVQDVQRRT